MICDKCGKSNISELKECSYCGAEMPLKTASIGFADILKYNPQDAGMTTDTMPCYEKNAPFDKEGEKYMQKLVDNSDKIIKTTRTNNLFGIIAVGLGVLVLISSMVFGIMTVKQVKKYREETMVKIEEAKIEVAEYKKEVDKLLETGELKAENIDEPEPETVTEGSETPENNPEEPEADENNLSDEGMENNITN